MYVYLVYYEFGSCHGRLKATALSEIEALSNILLDWTSDEYIDSNSLTSIFDSYMGYDSVSKLYSVYKCHIDDIPFIQIKNDINKISLPDTFKSLKNILDRDGKIEKILCSV